MHSVASLKVAHPNDSQVQQSGSTPNFWIRLLSTYSFVIANTGEWPLASVIYTSPSDLHVPVFQRVCLTFLNSQVKVLVRSDELKRRYKHDPVIISFEWGKGVVYHMISHFYLQRSETRTQKHGKQTGYIMSITHVSLTRCYPMNES